MTASILELSETQLEKAEAKVTHLGEQSKPIATVVFHTPDCDLKIKDFAILYQTHELYTNDELPYTRYFSVTPHEFSEILRSLRPILSDVKVSQGSDFLSFTILLRGKSNTEGHEFKIGYTDGKIFFQSILQSLRDDNEVGRQIIQKQLIDIFPQ